LKPLLWVGLCMSSLVLGVCLWAALRDPTAATVTYENPTGQYLPPSTEHPLGLDRNGRDILSRLVHSTRAFLGPGLLASALGVLLGVGGGVVRGWYQGLPGRMAGIVLAAVDSVPRLALILLATAAFKGRMWAVATALAVSYAPTVANEVHGRIALFRQEEFIAAARALGLSSAQILFLHILWLNSRQLLMKWAAFLFGSFILVETSLSYLGTIEGSASIGVAEPLPSLGNMLARAKDTLLTEVWPALIPVLAIMFSIVAFLLLAEGLGEHGAVGGRKGGHGGRGLSDGHTGERTANSDR